jgi:tetratricopeptide (TPR) repeat protein
VQQASVDMEKRLWGDRDHSDVAVGLHLLARILSDMGRLEDALSVQQASVGMYKRLWGDRDDSDVASGLHLLALILRDMGRLQDALSVQQASVDMYKRLWGDRDHRDVAVGLRNIASLSMHMGHLDAACEFAVQAGSMLQRVCGVEGNTSVARWLCLDGSLHRRRCVGAPRGGGATLAFASYTAALAMLQRLTGTRDDHDVARCHRKVAVALQELGRVAEALPHAQQAVDIVHRMRLPPAAFNDLSRKCQVRLDAVVNALALSVTVPGPGRAGV